jgi:hypothetical protein
VLPSFSFIQQSVVNYSCIGQKPKLILTRRQRPPFYKKLQLLVMVIKASQLGRQQKEIFVGMPVRLGCTGFQSSARALSWLRAV